MKPSFGICAALMTVCPVRTSSWISEVRRVSVIPDDA
jgi:hypothetical protein